MSFVIINFEPRSDDNNTPASDPLASGSSNVSEEIQDVVVKTEPEEPKTIEVEVSQLYEDHEIKEEVVVGPVVLQKGSENSYFAFNEVPVQDVVVTTEPEAAPPDKIEIEVPAPDDLQNTADTVVVLSQDADKSFSDVPSPTYTYKCDTCGQTNTDENPFPCDVCNERYPCECNLHIHRYIHMNEKDLVCDVCRMRFPNKWDLEGHRGKHTGVKPFQCDQCNKRFTHKSFLRRHQRRHDGDPYTCGICDKCFIYKSDLKKHSIKCMKRLVRLLG